MVTVKPKECINAFVKALREQNAAVFIGAGLSKSSGFVDWKELMSEITDDLGLDINKESDLIAIAQYHVNERFGNRNLINQNILERFTKDVTLTENHRLLAELPIFTYWTTNYDKLIEKALEESGKTPDVKVVSENICHTLPKRDAVVYKMHGDVSNPNEAVLTKEDYETYESKRSPYSILLQSDLFSKTFLFIGFSFDDPNLIYILTRIKNLIGTKATRNHFAFFKRETEPDKQRKQDLRLNDLKRYGILSVLLDDYSDINKILFEISNYYKRTQVFISGSAETFDEFSDEYRAKNLIHFLSREIVNNDFKLISGFGKNIGSGVINGALEYIFSTKNRKLDNYLKLMPFPQYVSENTEGLTVEEINTLKRKRNDKYRKLMISQAGIIIFLFGNKLDKNTNEIRLSERGMYEEFKIAKEQGLKPIPIGATGYMAKKIWSEVINDFDTYFQDFSTKLLPLFEIIGDQDKSNKDIINATINIIKILNRV